MTQRAESKRILREIRRVLMEVWDPIGVQGIPEAQDEYDCCLGTVYHLLLDGGSNEEIADYLWKEATEHMGLSLDRENMHATVSALRMIQLPEH
jgi:hypothetical protein